MFGLINQYGAIGASPNFVIIGPDGIVIDSWARNIAHLEASVASVLNSGSSEQKPPYKLTNL